MGADDDPAPLDPRCGSGGRRAAGRRRVGDAGSHHRQSVHHDDDDRRAVRRLHQARELRAGRPDRLPVEPTGDGRPAGPWPGTGAVSGVGPGRAGRAAVGTPGAMTGTVILDADGTLVDTNYHHAIAWYRAFRRYDVDDPGLDHPPRDRDGRRPAGRRRRGRRGGGRPTPTRSPRGVDRAGRRDAGRVQPPCPARTPCSRRSANQGLGLVMASSGKPHHVERYAELIEAGDLADAWVSSGDVEQTKPAPDLMAVAMERVGAGAAVAIGDSVWDCRAAGRLGIPAVAVRTGGFSNEELRDSGAVSVYESVDELTKDVASLEPREPQSSPPELRLGAGRRRRRARGWALMSGGTRHRGGGGAPETEFLFGVGRGRSSAVARARGDSRTAGSGDTLPWNRPGSASSYAGAHRYLDGRPRPGWDGADVALGRPTRIDGRVACGGRFESGDPRRSVGRDRSRRPGRSVRQLGGLGWPGRLGRLGRLGRPHRPGWPRRFGSRRTTGQLGAQLCCGRLHGVERELPRPALLARYSSAP